LWFFGGNICSGGCDGGSFGYGGGGGGGCDGDGCESDDCVVYGCGFSGFGGAGCGVWGREYVCFASASLAVTSNLILHLVHYLFACAVCCVGTTYRVVHNILRYYKHL
jgi:hypothetical protein